MPWPLSPRRAAAEHRPGESAELRLAPPWQTLGPAGPMASKPKTHPAQQLQKQPHAPGGGPGPHHRRAHGRRPRSRPAGQQQARAQSAGRWEGKGTGGRPAPPRAPRGEPASHPLSWSRRCCGDASSTSTNSADTSALALKGPKLLAWASKP